jgi:hypothetical protein
MCGFGCGLGSTLGHLSTLKQLSLWFDHSDTCSWTMVNERKLLSPLLAHLSRTFINVSIILPKLHPLHEREDRHFINVSLGKSVRLHRTLRQRWHSHQYSLNSMEVIHKPDFPLGYDIVELYDGTWAGVGETPGVKHLSTVEAMAQIEEEERRDWKEGVDVERKIQDIIGPKGNFSHLL